MKTIKQIVNRYSIKANCERVGENPNMTDIPQGSSHWKVKLKAGRRVMTVYFSQGPAHCKKPTAREVIGCLISDAGCVQWGESFEDFCSELGYDEDSRKAEEIFKTTQKQTKKLMQFLPELNIYDVELD